MRPTLPAGVTVTPAGVTVTPAGPSGVKLGPSAVKIISNVSIPTIQVKNKVIQGSILGHLLFRCFINNMHLSNIIQNFPMLMIPLLMLHVQIVSDSLRTNMLLLSH